MVRTLAGFVAILGVMSGLLRCDGAVSPAGSGRQPPTVPVMPSFARPTQPSRTIEIPPPID